MRNYYAYSIMRCQKPFVLIKMKKTYVFLLKKDIMKFIFRLQISNKISIKTKIKIILLLMPNFFRTMYFCYWNKKMRNFIISTFGRYAYNKEYIKHNE